MFITLLSVLYLAVLGSANELSAAQLVPHSQSSTGLPDVLPYKLFLDASQRAEADMNLYDRLSFFMDARHKKARVAYSDGPHPEVIGFDLYIRAEPLGILPVQDSKKVSVYTTYQEFDLSFPLEPKAWESTQFKYTLAHKKFTRREAFMKNKKSEFYCRFRASNGANPEETRRIVDLINSTKDISLKGITKVNRLFVSANHRRGLLAYSFRKHSRATVYLDAEYETPVLMSEETIYIGDFAMIPFLIVCSIALAASVILVLCLLYKGDKSSAICALPLTLILIMFITWGGTVLTTYLY